QRLAFYRSQLGDRIGNPRGPRFDEPKPTFREFLQKTGAHQFGGGVHDQEPPVPFVPRQRMAGVNAERQVERAGFLVNWKKVRVGDLPVEVESALEDAADSVLFRPTQRLDSLIGPKQRQYSRPA